MTAFQQYCCMKFSWAWNSYGSWKFIVIQLIFMNMNFEEKFMNFVNMNLKAMNMPWIWISDPWMSSNMNQNFMNMNMNTDPNSWTMMNILVNIHESYELYDTKGCFSWGNVKIQIWQKEIYSWNLWIYSWNLWIIHGISNNVHEYEYVRPMNCAMNPWIWIRKLTKTPWTSSWTSLKKVHRGHDDSWIFKKASWVVWIPSYEVFIRF